MLYVRRFFFYSNFLLAFNALFFWFTWPTGPAVKIPLLLLLAGLYAYYSVIPRKSDAPTPKLNILIGGYELVIAAVICFWCEAVFYTGLLFLWKPAVDTIILVLNAAASIVLTAGLLFNGFARVLTMSSHLGLTNRFALIFLWWVPGLDLVLLYKTCKTVRSEYLHLCHRFRVNAARRQDQVCATRYPLLMIHGIFFRDWDIVSYWGRIPDELKENGATIYYGEQQSSSSVEKSAYELKARILSLVEATHCEKVNIIAHSKGGLDARFAISCLGMDKTVASLLTVNTPHRGTPFAGKLLERVPQRVSALIADRYNAIFSKLGDESPDFFNGVSELTPEKCAQLNESMPDRAGVLYQSVGSKMRSHKSAPFPLNLGYSIIKTLDGDNDGLVNSSSMPWGHFLGTLEPAGKIGISHSDVIDRPRRSIEGFDVCEWYVTYVKDLKARGL